MKQRWIVLALVSATLLGCVACGSKNPGSGETTPTTSAATEESGNESVGETVDETVGESAADTAAPESTADTCPEAPTETDWSAWKPTPGADVTELTVSGTVAGTGSGSEDATEQIYAYAPGDPNYSLKEADADGTTVTLRNSTVSALRLATAFDDGTIARYEGKVQIAHDPADANWCSLFIGLRLSDAAAEATSQNGIWLAIKSNKIGMRTNTWAETTLTTIKANGVNFATERMLYIEDNMQTDVITLWADNDAGEKVEIATVKLEDGKINFYHPGGDKPVISDKIVGSINASGCLSLWLHHTKNKATIRDFKATGVAAEKFTAPTANLWAGRDILSDTWVSIDNEGRITGTENGPVGDKKVGIFYFLWNDGASSQPIYDHAAAFAEGGRDKLIEILQAGPLGFAHYWAEPYFGYYQSNDEWVIRKHTYQLTAAGVDFIFIDATNGLTYERNYETILKVWSEMRAEGHDTPQIVFHCGNTQNLAQASFNALWGNLYGQERYKDLWFLHDGKPLIFMPHTLYEALTAEQQAFFTYRQSWAYTKDSWYTATRGKGAWAWADMYPQRPGLSPSGELEQMIVMCGFWVNGSYGTNAGRSYSYKNGGQPGPSGDANDFGFNLVDTTSGKGIAFEEQFDYAIEKDPELIMITGWNEWWAGRWENNAAGQTIANTYTVTKDDNWTKNYFVDCFNPEYSRDVEPVKGYFNDNYYYQMVQNIRQYKGSRVPLAAFGQRPIDMDGDLSQWDIVGPEFRDFTGDVTHRDHMSYVGQIHYTNDTGRNDFTVAKVSKYEGKVYFYAACASDITAPAGTNWMNLYIDADADPTTGWYGYDYLLNRTRDGETCSVQKFVDGDGAWTFEDAGTASIKVVGKTIQIGVDADTLGLGATFDFKWADNSVDDGQIMQFLDLGDTAPDGRFNYRYTEVQAEIQMPEVMTSDMVALKAGSYFAYVNGEMVRLDETTTKATFFGDEQHLYLPQAFAAEIFDTDVSGIKSYNHYGVSYIDITELLGDTGKTVSRSENLVVIGDRALTEDEMLTIYRAMY